MKNEFNDLVVKNSSGLVIINGEFVLKKMAMDKDLGLWGNVVALTISYVVLLSASYLALYLISRRKN